MELNTNNLQTAFNYKPKSNEYVFNTISNTLALNSNAIYLKYFEGEDLFCVDLGYSIDGDVSKMKFSINGLTVYPVLLTTVDKVSEQTINEQEIYLISDDINFKSIIFIPKIHLNKTFKYTITSINTTFSSFMLDEIGRKFNDTAIVTRADQVSQDNSNGLGNNVQVALDTLLSKIKTSDTSQAINVNYDNSKTNLLYLSGYDFPKFSVEIPTYNLVLTDGTTDYNATISKQSDGSYLLSGVLDNFNITNANEVDIQIKSINNIDVSQFQAVFSILAQFFELGNILTPDYISTQENEINIQDNNNNFQFGFIVTESGSQYFALRIKSISSLNTTPSTITLNIKNRILKPSDIYIHYVEIPSANIKKIQLIQDNDSVKYTGEYNAFGSTFEQIIFYSDLDMSNYFNLVSNYYNLNNTTGITSSSGKAVKFGIQSMSSTAQNIYVLYLAYQDDSSITEGDVFTFNLTPDKNSTLNPVYSPAANVQQAIESIVLNRIKPIGSVYFQIAKEDGSFDDNESPENLFGGVWEIQHANDSVFLRTEGALSNEGRNNGIQNYAIKAFSGKFSFFLMRESNCILAPLSSEGFIFSDNTGQNSNYNTMNVPITNPPPAPMMGYDISRVMNTSANEIRVINILIRIWKRIS